MLTTLDLLKRALHAIETEVNLSGVDAWGELRNDLRVRIEREEVLDAMARDAIELGLYDDLVPAPIECNRCGRMLAPGGEA